MVNEKNPIVRWGIIGAGMIAHKFAKEVNRTENGVLAAVYARNEEKVKKFCDVYDVESYYTDINDFLNSNNIDAVYVALPHSLHAEYCLKAAKAGKHILCEKPFSYNEESSRKVLKAAKENSVFIMEALWTLFLPAIKRVKQWVDTDRIGKINLITADFGFKAAKDMNSRLYNPDLAGGALLDVGIYTILVSNYFMNQIPESINAVSVLSESKIDETDVISLRYRVNSIASLKCSISDDMDQTAVIYGEKGKIVIPHFSKAKEAFLYCGQTVESFKDCYDGYGYMYEIEEANKCIINSRLESEQASHEKTLQLAEIMDQIRKQINVKYPFE